MIIQRVRFTNYKTYLSLDLDLNVDGERPIIHVSLETQRIVSQLPKIEFWVGAALSPAAPLSIYYHKQNTK